MPVTAGIVAGGLQTVGGLAQSIFGGGAKKRAIREMEALQTPTYAGSASISDYYNKALDKYNKAAGVNPYESAQFRQAQQDAGRSLATGLGSLSDRRSAVGSVNKLLGVTNNNLARAGATAENMARAERNASLSQLGGAASAKAGDDRYGFQINQLMPYQKRLNELQMRAGGAAATQQAGLNNIFGGLSGLASMGVGKMFGGGQQVQPEVSGTSYGIPSTYGAYSSRNNYFG